MQIFEDINRRILVALFVRAKIAKTSDCLSITKWWDNDLFILQNVMESLKIAKFVYILLYIK